MMNGINYDQTVKRGGEKPRGMVLDIDERGHLWKQMQQHGISEGVIAQIAGKHQSAVSKLLRGKIYSEPIVMAFFVFSPKDTMLHGIIGKRKK
jgi:hypothetical protein